MKRTFVVVTSLLIFAAFAYALVDSQNLGGVFRTATPTLTNTPTLASTPTSTNTFTPSPTFTATPTFTITSTATSTPIAMSTPVLLQPTQKPKNDDGGGGGFPGVGGNW